MKKLIVIMISVLVLGGCSTISKYAKRGRDSVTTDVTSQDGSSGMSGAQSRGIGERVGFISEDKFMQATLDAPANQTYHFGFNQYTVSQDLYDSIQAQADYLVEHPRAHVMVEGHTDARGSREYNIGLGERRAKAVADVLMSFGVGPTQIETVSYGKERPVAYGEAEADYAKNRRANLIFTQLG